MPLFNDERLQDADKCVRVIPQVLKKFFTDQIEDLNVNETLNIPMGFLKPHASIQLKKNESYTLDGSFHMVEVDPMEFQDASISDLVIKSISVFDLLNLESIVHVDDKKSSKEEIKSLIKDFVKEIKIRHLIDSAVQDKMAERDLMDLFFVSRLNELIESEIDTKETKPKPKKKIEVEIKPEKIEIEVDPIGSDENPPEKSPDLPPDNIGVESTKDDHRYPDEDPKMYHDREILPGPKLPKNPKPNTKPTIGSRSQTNDDLKEKTFHVGPSVIEEQPEFEGEKKLGKKPNHGLPNPVHHNIESNPKFEGKKVKRRPAIKPSGLSTVEQKEIPNKHRGSREQTNDDLRERDYNVGPSTIIEKPKFEGKKRK